MREITFGAAVNEAIAEEIDPKKSAFAQTSSRGKTWGGEGGEERSGGGDFENRIVRVETLCAGGEEEEEEEAAADQETSLASKRRSRRTNFKSGGKTSAEQGQLSV